MMYVKIKVGGIWEEDDQKLDEDQWPEKKLEMRLTALLRYLSPSQKLPISRAYRHNKLGIPSASL